MDKLRDLLKGKKTYLQAAAAGVVVALMHVGFIDKELGLTLLGLFGAGTVASLGAKIDRGKQP